MARAAVRGVARDEAARWHRVLVTGGSEERELARRVADMARRESLNSRPPIKRSGCFRSASKESLDAGRHAPILFGLDKFFNWSVN